MGEEEFFLNRRENWRLLNIIPTEDGATTHNDKEQNLGELSLHEVEGSIEIFIHDLNLTLTGHLEFSRSDAENSLELTIHEEPNSDPTVHRDVIQNEKLRTSKWMDELKSSSPTAIFTDTGGIHKNLSGTIFYSGISIWRLERLISRENHYDVYSSTSSLNPKNVKKDALAWRVRAYAFHGISDHVAKFRRRNMKRLSTSHGAFRIAPDDGNIYVPFIVDSALDTQHSLVRSVPALSTPAPISDFSATLALTYNWFEFPLRNNVKHLSLANAFHLGMDDLDSSYFEQEISGSHRSPTEGLNLVKLKLESKKEKDRIKQRERRRRQRASKRSDLTECSDQNLQASSEITAKRHKPTPIERSMRFILGLYDFDRPPIDPMSATEPAWEEILASSATIRRAANVNVTNTYIEDEIEIEELLEITRREISFLKKLQLQLPRIQEISTESDKSANRSTEFSLENIKIEYASRILPQVINILGLRQNSISHRLKSIHGALQEWEACYRSNTGREKEKLDKALRNMIPGSPAWNTASSKMKNLEDQAEVYRKEKELWMKYKETLRHADV